MQSQYDGYKIDPIMIISQHPLARCCNEVARASVGRAARGHLVRAHRPPRPSQAPRPPASRGRAAVTTNLGEETIYLLTIYQYLIITLSSRLHPLLPGLGGF